MSEKTAREKRKLEEEAEARADRTVKGEVMVRLYESGRAELLCADPSMSPTEAMTLLLLGQQMCVQTMDEIITAATRRKVERSGLVVLGKNIVGLDGRRLS